MGQVRQSVRSRQKRKYSDANCTEGEKGGAYYWLKGKQVEAERIAEGKTGPIPFTGASVGGGGVLSTGSLECVAEGQALRVSRGDCLSKGGKLSQSEGIAIECEKENATGQASGKNKVENIQVTFKGCQTEGIPCTSKGNAEGEISTSTLEGELGYIEGGAGVGVRLTPAVSMVRSPTSTASKKD